MFVFAIETCGKTVAFTKETDRVMLDGILNGEREEGQILRLMTKYDKRAPSPFTARLASDAEEDDYDGIASMLDENLPSYGVNGDANIIRDNGVIFFV